MSLLDDLLVGFDEALDWPLDDSGDPDEGSFEPAAHRIAPAWEPTS